MMRYTGSQVGLVVRVLALGQLLLWTAAGCPSIDWSALNAALTATAQTGSPSENPGGSSETATNGGNDGTPAGDDGSPGDIADTDGTGPDTGTGGDADASDASDAVDEELTGYTPAQIIHRAAGGFAADPKFGIPAASHFNSSSGGIQTSVRIPQVTKDGQRIWFAAQDGNGFVKAQLFCINVDGSGLTEIPLPADPNLWRAPAELAPSANGEVCALRLETGDGTDFSQTVICLATLATGQVATVYDGRTITGGNDDFKDVQITDDGAAIYFRCDHTGTIYRVPATGGELTTVANLGDFSRAASAPRWLNHFRINGDASLLVANVAFNGPNNTYPNDIYLKTAGGVEALTNTGDAPQQNHPYEYLGASDDGRYVLYRRFFSSESRYRTYVLDRTSNVTTALDTGRDATPALLDSAGTLVLTWFAIDRPYGGYDQLPGLGTPDGAGALELTETWAGRASLAPVFTSLSAGAGVLAGTWANGAFGDPTRLYVWLPNATAYRTGPSIVGVSYKLDPTTGTLTTRAVVNGPVTHVGILYLYQDFESFYQLEDQDDPFFNERFGQEMNAADSAGVYEYAADVSGFALDSEFRIRVTVADNAAKNFACVDFRPVPLSSETVDTNGDGIGD